MPARPASRDNQTKPHSLVVGMDAGVAGGAGRSIGANGSTTVPSKGLLTPTPLSVTVNDTESPATVPWANHAAAAPLDGGPYL